MRIAETTARLLRSQTCQVNCASFSAGLPEPPTAESPAGVVG